MTTVTSDLPEKGTLAVGVHLFTARWQPFTRYRDVDGTIFTNHPRHVFQCHHCRSRRQAKNLKIQVFYHLVRIECADGCYGQRGRRWEE